LCQKTQGSRDLPRRDRVRNDRPTKLSRPSPAETVFGPEHGMAIVDLADDATSVGSDQRIILYNHGYNHGAERIFGYRLMMVRDVDVGGKSVLLWRNSSGVCVRLGKEALCLALSPAGVSTN
jgi:hypothetical protein